MKLNKISILAFATILPLTAIAKEPKTVLVSQSFERTQFVTDEDDILEPAFDEAAYDSLCSHVSILKATNEHNTADTMDEENGNRMIDAQTEEAPIDYTKKQAIVVHKRSHVLRGNYYVADIVMLNRDPNCTYTTFVGKMDIKDGRYRVRNNAIGTYKYSGFIQETDKKGNVQLYRFTGTYTVAEPDANISSKTMDVLFAGTSNEVEVSAPGFSTSDLRIAVSNAVTVKTSKGWDIRPMLVDKPCIVSVSAKIDGKETIVGRKQFKTLPLPTPTAFLSERIYDLTSYEAYDKIVDGKEDKDSLLKSKKIVAKCEQMELFSKEPRYKVLEFDMKFYDRKGHEMVLHSNSDLITDEMREAMNKLKSGDCLYITNIASKGADGMKRMLSPIEVTVK
ncbi:MAG: hypothetical protein MJZ23_01160 [Paludibacteraceae bacterium]|nr:hypothetical protein [Paludibacteraceae bacterium]